MPVHRPLGPVAAAICVLLAACGTSTTPSTSGTSSTSASVPRLAVTPSPGVGGSPFWVPVPMAVDSRARLGGLLPHGGAAAGTAYVVLGGDTIRALAPDGSVTSLPGTPSPATLAVSPVQPTRLAWGEFTLGSGATLVTAPASGAPVTTLRVPAFVRSAGDTQVLAARWSNDGASIYYVREEIGLGGSGFFEGVSSLYRFSLATNASTAIVPFSPSPSATGGCVDDLSADETRLADHCDGRHITIRDLRSGAAVVLRPPTTVTGDRIGNARFSPDGSLIAFGIGRSTLDATEQCWLAVGPSTGGNARVVWTGARGDLLAVVGWLDQRTVLLQTMSTEGSTTSLSTLRLGDPAATSVASGLFAALG